MKAKKIVTGFLAGAIIIGAVYNCYNLVQDNTFSTVIKENVVYAEKSKELNNEELKSKAMETIKKYYNEEPDFNSLKFISGHTTIEEKKADIDSSIEFLKDENNFTNFTKEQKQEMLKELEEKKNRITHGEIYMGWVNNGPIEDSPQSGEMYEVNLNDKTQEVISINYVRNQDISKIKLDNFVSTEQSQKIAEDFILKNNLMNIKDAKLKDIKLIGEYESKYYVTADYDAMDSIIFFYEGVKDSSKKVSVSVDRTLGKVNYFSVGSEAEEQARIIINSESDFKSQNAKEKDLKNEAMNLIEEYYSGSPDFNKLKFTMEHETVEDIKDSIDTIINGLKDGRGYEYLTKEQRENRINKLEESKNTVKNGMIYMTWISNEPIIEYPNEDELYQIVFNDKTKQILSMEYIISQDLRNLKPEDFISMEESQKIAKAFIIENSICDIKNMKLIKKTEAKSHLKATYDASDSVVFGYEDINDSSKTINVQVDRTLGKVNSFVIEIE